MKLKTRVNVLEYENDANSQMVDSLFNQVHDLSTQGNEMFDRIDDLEADIVELEQQIAKVSENLLLSSEVVAEVAASIVKQGGVLSATHLAIAKLNDASTKTNARIDTVLQFIDNLLDRVKALEPKADEPAPVATASVQDADAARESKINDAFDALVEALR